MVTVSSAQQSAPKSIFPMSQCTSDSDGFLTIGCLARGFSPADSVTFKWKNHADKVLSDFVQYPAFGREGDYAKISHMRVRKSEWDPQKPYKCEASNSKGTIYSRVAPAPIRVNKPTIALLSRKDGDRMVLECQLNDYFPDKLTVQWLEDDRSTRGQIDKKFQNTDKGEKNYTYISQLPISAPYEDKKYTCKATFNSEEIKKEYNMCEAPDNTKVSWLTDDVKKPATKEDKGQSNNIVSNLTLSRNEWVTLKTVICIAKHPCFPEERDEIPAGYIKKDPVVVIRRTLMKSAQADSAELECVVNDLPSAPPPDLRASVYMTVPSKMELENGTATFMCVAQRFSPKAYAFKWFQDGRDVTNAIEKFDKSEKNGSETEYSATSILQISAEEWQPNSKMKCQFEHKAGNQEKEVEYTDCDESGSDIDQDIVPPSPEDMLKNRVGLLKCKASAENAGFVKITIKANNNIIANNSGDKYFQDRKTVELDAPIGYEEWSNGTEFTCTIEHRELAEPKEKTFSRENAIRVNKPTLALLSRKDGDRIVLECQLNEYFPDKLTVQWLEGDKSVKGQIDKKFQNTDKGEKNYTYISQLPISAPYEDKKYTCKATFNSEELKKEYKTCEAQSLFKPSVQIKRSHLRDIIQESKVTVSCVVEAPDNTTVSWLTDNENKTATEEVKDPSNNTVSNLTLSKDEWLTLKTVVCIAKHPCFPEQRNEIPADDIKKDPVVVIRRTLMKSAQADSAVLECVVNDLPSGDATIELSVISSVGQSSSDSQKLLCSVTGFDPKIKWLSQSIEKTGRDPDVTVMEDGRVKVYSEILVPQQEWTQGVTYTCQATSRHSGKTADKSTSVCTGYIKKDPVVVIRRTLMKSAQADSAVLECVVNDLPSADATIELSVVPSVGQSSSDSQKLLCSVTGFNPKIKWLSQYREKTGSASDVTVMEDGRVKAYSEILVPRQEWTQGVTYTCQATSRHSGKTADKSTSVCTGYIKKDPVVVIRRTLMKSAQADSAVLECVVNDLPSGDVTIELAVVPSVGQSSSDSQKLLCSVTGFDPKIKWLSQSREKTGRDPDVTVMEDGRVKAYSEILVPQQEWNQGVTYTCQTKTAEKNASICTVIAPYSQQAGVYLLGPSLRNVRSATNVNLTCLVVGQSVKLFSIQWKVNGVLHNGYRQDPKDHNNGTESIEHILRVSVEKWNTYAVFTCEVRHLCSKDKPQKKTISKIRDPIQPNVAILSPSDSVLFGLQNASLLCLITGFFPSDISVQWQLNGTELDVSQFSNSPVVNDTSGGFAIYSALMLPASERKDGVFSCVVSHESSQNPIIATIENLYASVIETAPSAMLLQGASELVCLVFGFSPPAINITWLLGTTEVFAHRVSNPAKGPDGKFSIQSYLDFQPSDWAPGEVYTCKVTHVADNVSRSISKTALFEEAIFMNENKPEAIAQDTVEETWNMACAFLALFLLSLIYGCTVTLVKVKRI
ncbi:membrane-bound immunoglobulin [Labeo rohita]|nr:membrane-bound immunoglobulin [Labeo rohita]